jgi:acetylornithine deacetylase/succinyl-diaminopimelate desuccinylase-like protein
MEHSIFLSRDCCKETPPSSGSPAITKLLLDIAVSTVFACKFREKRPTQALKHGSRRAEDVTPFSTWHVSLALAEHPLPDTLTATFPNRKSILTFPTLIRGGSSINVVPGSCEAYGDVRLIPGITVDEVKAIITEQLERLNISSYRLDDIPLVPAAETNPQTEIVQTLAATVEMNTSVRPRLEGSGPACDGWMFITRGVPTVCGYGVACGGVHGADEWVDLESLQMVTEVYAHTVMRFCGDTE